MVIVLGKTFSSDDERREYFRGELRKQLPELKKIEGFPIGEDEDIIALSDPPYYTVCPNPWINDFIAEWEEEKKTVPNREKDFHVAEPYGYDVKEGVNNPVYVAHSYHTKVPHPAIMRFLLHYTQPGDIILDSFAGTGMCGVAANACGNPDTETKFKIESEWRNSFGSSPRWGRRKALLNDLSPIASFISSNYNSPVDPVRFFDAAEALFAKVDAECSWMFNTRHTDKTIGKVNYVVWSECVSCANCGAEIILYEATVNYKSGTVTEAFECPTCQFKMKKGDCDKIRSTQFDDHLEKAITTIKYKPVLINYSVGTKRFEKTLDEQDLSTITKIDSTPIDARIPISRMPEGDESRRNDRIGIENVHQFYSKRNLIVLSKFFEYSDEFEYSNKLKFILTSILPKLTNMNRYMPQHGSRALVGPMANTLYIPPMFVENNSLDQYTFQKKKIVKAFNGLNYSVGSVHSATKITIGDNSIDYVFTDPPFGSNIMYSELNFLSESWLGVKTNNKQEAIANKTQGKQLPDYQHLMTQSFREYHRVLKHGRWMTVEFSNTSAAVWNVIQTSIQLAGFIISSVTAIDNTRGGLHAMLGPTAMKQNLIISCYKPNQGFVDQLKAGDATVNIWTFVESHLNHLPVHIGQSNQTLSVAERNPRVIYDRLLSYFIVNNIPVPIGARDFREGLKQRFVEIDEMFFTKDQSVDYDDQKRKAPLFVQLSLIVTNEGEAIEWLRSRLRNTRQKYNEIMPEFRIATQAMRKGDVLPELQHILNENFIQEGDGRWRSPDVNEAKDREAMRNKALLKEFGDYVTLASGGKKLKEVRVEALRVGFKTYWERKEFKTILTVAEKIPNNILLEDEQLLMYYDIALNFV